MRISLFSADTNNEPQTLDVTWEEHVEGLRTDRPVECPQITLNKQREKIPVTICPSLTEGSANKCTARKVEMWSPSIYEGTRSDANVIGMSCIVLDLDHLTKEQAHDLGSKVLAFNWKCILHSTHSHNPAQADGKGYCYRLILAVKRELTADEIKPTRDMAQAQLGIRADEHTKDLSRAYYLPTRPKNGPEYEFDAVGTVEIEPVTGGVSLAVVAPRTPTSQEPLPEFLQRKNGDMKNLRAQLARRAPGDDLLRKVLAGVALANEGGRDAALQSLAGKIAYIVKDGHPEALMELARDSIMAMTPPESGDWWPIWRDKIERACVRHEADVRTKLEANRVGRYVLKKQAIAADPDSDNPANMEDFDEIRMAQWASQHGCDSVEEFKQQMIIRHRGGNWIFTNGHYRECVPDSDIEFSIMRDFARAPVNLTTLNKTGDEVLRPIKQILLDYSTVSRSVVGSLSLVESYYDRHSQCFHEAVCPIRRDLRPKEHKEVHQWLELFGGEPLLDWVACVVKLDKPAAALYIEGPKGTGKNVLADGLARLWHKGVATQFKDVIGSSFNDSLTRCPLIHADEGIPKTDTVIDDLRRLIGSSGCSLNRKFMPVVPLEGCPRLIITANNERVLLDTGAQLGPQDIEAVTQRIRRVQAGPEPVEYLESFRKSKGRGYIESWVKDDAIAQHALWLSENREVDESTRFLVEGDDPAQAELMTTGTGQVGAVMEFLARYLSDPAAIKTPKVRIGNGELLVNTEALAQKDIWERYVPSRKIPSARLISDSLRAVAIPDPVTVDGMEFFRIKPHIVVNWSRTNQVGSATLIEAKVRESK